MNLDSSDARHRQRSCRQLGGDFPGIAASEMINVNPVVDLERVRPGPMVQATTTDDHAAMECAGDDVASATPALPPVPDQVGTCVIAEWLVSYEWHPRSEVLDAVLDRSPKDGNVATQPSTEGEPRADNEFGQDGHGISLPSERIDITRLSRKQEATARAVEWIVR